MTDAAFDPYSTLGLRPGADATLVRDAYRRLARRHHPDRSGDRRATERMQAINRAWAMLSDPARRARLDASTPHGRPSTSRYRPTAQGGRAQWARPASSWTGSAAAPPYRSPVPSAGDGPSWLGVLAAILLLMLIGPVLFWILPLPFAGLFVVFALGTLTRGWGR